MDWYAKNDWNRAWAVVTDLIQAGATTVAISGGQAASLLLEATGDVPAIDLANASIGLSMKTSTNVGYQIIAAKSLVPLIGLCKIQWAFFPWPHQGVSPLAAPGTDPEMLADLQGPQPTPAAPGDVYFGQLR
jgi:hypothetical protein